MTVGFYGYLGAALGFGFFTVLLLFSWRSSDQVKLLTAAVFSTAVWAMLAMAVALDDRYPSAGYQVFEVLRYVFWYLFLLKLFEPAARQIVGHSFLQRHARTVVVGSGLLVILLEMTVRYVPRITGAYDVSAPGFAGHILLSIIGLSIIEQLYRNLAVSHRYIFKYLFIGAGVIFAFDLYLYTNALIFMDINRELWEARGFINLFTVPLLVLSATRNKDRSPNIFISRDIVLHATAVVGSGLYLLMMVVAGYYLQEYGGSWGHVVKFTFLTLAAIFLVAVLFSMQIRRQLRVFLGKHFYRNKYDYRREWLSLTRALSKTDRETGSYETIIRALGQLVDARAGSLWLRDERGEYSCAANWGSPRIDTTEPADSSLVRFLDETGYVINLQELATQPDQYRGLKLPAWLADIGQGWLIVPLPGTESMLGFVVLARPLVAREVNWEDRDLLKTAARQVAGHLVIIMTTDALAQAKQFEVFNRLSSYMVHDLKNIAAGLEMVAVNAVRHRDNPAFLVDAFDSVSTAAADIKRLLEQLRSKQVPAGKSVLIDMPDLLQSVVARRSGSDPVPALEPAAGICQVTTNRQRLENVLLHLVENAQQATTPAGHVTLGLRLQGPVCVVDITDDGHGMDTDFIRNRLFKPFDTTRGNAGMGIGMYESREFIRELGGEIHVNSVPGEGTVVSLHLPVTPGSRDPLPVPA
ncbi:MAG TPA: XrtA/PEP-CTERM system histidine kinase PrsK [Gammaproteobacteria bacterium]|nr:XrtA/PEP-CTERM system histidine kinase PrsK [Gammaproteobacteria bacterium]